MSELEEKDPLLELLPIEAKQRRLEDKRKERAPYGLPDRDVVDGQGWSPQGFKGSATVDASASRQAAGASGAHVMAAHQETLRKNGHELPAPLHAPAPRTPALPGPVQLKARRVSSTSRVLQAAASGLQGMHQSMPHMDRIQKSFGQHDLSGVRAFVGGRAQEANEQIGALAYATGDAVAFRDSPDLHTAAHEAAHVIQQRGGARPSGGVSSVGDEHERHADAVAERVVRGQSAEELLNQYAKPQDKFQAAPSVQLKEEAQGSRGGGEGRLGEALAILQKAMEDGQKQKSSKNPDQQGDDGKGSRGRIRQAMSRDPMEDLRKALTELSRLKESGSQEEIDVAVEAILSGSKGDASQVQASTHGREALDSAKPPVQKFAAAAAAPLAVAGPPGWAVLAGAALLTLGLGVYAMARSRNEQAVSTQTDARTRAQEREQDRQQHRGRLQVQGQDMRQEISFPWAQNTPMTKAVALAALENLKNQLSRSELRIRRQAFERARAFIQSTNTTVPPAVSRTFQDRNLGGNNSARVDIEIWTGTAFV